MTMTMTTNQQVQFYLTYSDKRASKHRKIQRMQELERELEQRHIFLDELFQRKTIRVLDEIAYMTTICGVIKIGADRLASNAEVSMRTVYNAVRAIKENPMGFYIGYLKGSHKYVFVDLKHTDAREMLADLFNLSKSEIEAIFAVHFAGHSSPKNLSIPTDKERILVSNNITNNKTLKDIKTFTKTSESSASNNNLYNRLKTLFKARKGSLNGFRALVGVLYGKMKKLKADATVKLSHAQIEAVMYQSLDVLLNKSNVKNNEAMLNGIIKNKVADLTTPKTTPTVNNIRVEHVPSWWNERNDPNVDIDSDSPAIDFEAERARILRKLDIQPE